MIVVVNYLVLQQTQVPLQNTYSPLLKLQYIAERWLSNNVSTNILREILSYLTISEGNITWLSLSTVSDVAVSSRAEFVLFFSDVRDF